ncbi:MAG TPA: hypothetical protein VFZ23_12385 [Pyrinomonadaceae bacterium]
MNAKFVEPAANETAEFRGRSEFRKLLWSASATGSFAGSAFCFISGLMASLASMLGVLPVSPVTARWTVGILLTAFIFAFLGAHSVDKISEIRGSDQQPD